MTWLKLTRILHKLEKFWWDALTNKEREAVNIFRVGTERSTSKPPLVAPYNFGIDLEWWKAAKESGDWENVIGDWGKYADPQGFGENRYQSTAEDEQENAPENQNEEHENQNGEFADSDDDLYESVTEYY